MTKTDKAQYKRVASVRQPPQTGVRTPAGQDLKVENVEPDLPPRPAAAAAAAAAASESIYEWGQKIDQCGLPGPRPLFISSCLALFLSCSPAPRTR